MLSKEDREFMDYWESHRDREHSFARQMLVGGPWGLVFALPILIVVLFDGWYKRMLPVTRGQMVLIWIGVAGIAFFTAWFRQQMRWDRNEQIYQELKFKNDRNKGQQAVN